MKNRNFVNLNVNPCKMCMPMGAITAFKGIKNSMTILHGSQGCSTYIRRHMAAHFNEPVDIASSSLNEEGTVYGGESNLKKGLKNLIRLYNPEIIGVGTTCLAETIGEDIKRITAEFVEEEKLKDVIIVPVSTPGYGGTQFEGYYRALVCMVRQITGYSEPNGRVNIIVPAMSPGDIRNIKAMLELFEIDYILLPDISDSLDAPYSPIYSRTQDRGTGTGDIKAMGGARATIELGLTVPKELSPGQYLLEKYGVPLYKCPIPMGIENTGRLVELLSQLSGRPVPAMLDMERGRLIDGMIDSHKHNGEGRAVIYGEPELVLALGRLCLENGIKPVLLSTGSQNQAVKEELGGTEKDPLTHLELPVVIDDTDFDTIRKYAKELKANILIGNSDGKFITEKDGIPLVRIGFPIHDRVGGQRLVYTGYQGTLKLLDDITNTLLENKYQVYRQKMFDTYYVDDSGEKTQPEKVGKPASGQEEKTKAHPCFSGGSCRNARMHIPVAPACNISCNYCNRKYDCTNESRPGVTSEVLSPEEAARKFAVVREKMENLTVVGIAGPGDALANFENTKKSIQLITQIDPEITFCLSTNGLMLPHHADEIINLGISHVTITINAIDPSIGAKIYKEVNYNGKRYTGEQAAAVLIRNQLEGLAYLAARGVVCKVNIVLIKGVNDMHVEAVVKKVKAYGAYITNIMPLIPAEGSAFQHMPLTSNKELTEIRKKCEGTMKQMYHCKQCRADAIGTLDNDCSPAFSGKACGGCREEPAGEEIPAKAGRVLKFAVASKSGMYIDEHFGHVQEFHIYEQADGSLRLLEKRNVDKYCSGEAECDNEESKIDRIIRTIEDCNAVLVLRIGYRPMKALVDKGIKVFQTCGNVEEAIKSAVRSIDSAEVLLETVV